MFKITLKDNTFINVERDQAEMIVESLFEHISGIRLLEAEEEETHKLLSERLASKGIGLDKCEAMGFNVKPQYPEDVQVGTIEIEIPYGSIEIELNEMGDMVYLKDSFFNNNESMPISGGETIFDLIHDAEDQLEYLGNKYPDELQDDLTLLGKVIEDWKSITATIEEDAEPDLGNLDLETEEPDSTLVTECTTSGAVASVASPIGQPADPIKKPKVKVKRI